MNNFTKCEKIIFESIIEQTTIFDCYTHVNACQWFIDIYMSIIHTCKVIAEFNWTSVDKGSEKWEVLLKYESRFLKIIL